MLENPPRIAVHYPEPEVIRARDRIIPFERRPFSRCEAGDRLTVNGKSWGIVSRWTWESTVDPAYVVHVYRLRADDGADWVGVTGHDLAAAGAKPLGDLAQGLDRLVSDLVDQCAEHCPAAV